MADMSQYREMARQASEETATRAAETQWAKAGGQPGSMPAPVARSPEVSATSSPVQVEPPADPVAKGLADALAGFPLLPAGRDQLLKLWRDDFKASPSGVLSRDGKPLAETVAARLASAEYAHFVPETKNLGDAIIMQYQQRQAAAALAPGVVPASPAPQNLGDAIIAAFKDRTKDQPKPFGFGPV